MAKQNPFWGYDRIQGAVANLGYKISNSTIANIIRQHGIDPALDRYGVVREGSPYFDSTFERKQI
ncbi:MAG: hypothetical protein QUT30_12640 [Acidobacteriota bacterium]|nr:hypothetical protein [Acidobacteriota bacterium]